MSDNQLATRPTASSSLAAFIGMEPRMMLDTIKAQCFKNSRPDQISDAQLAAFVSIAAEMKVNPLLPGMLYAYPTQGAIVPMMGPDAVFKKLTEHPDVDSWETIVFPEDPAQPATHAITKIYRKSSERPLTYTAILSEWKVGSNPNWNSRPRHMLSLRSLKQCARQIIHGIPFDEDERQIMGEINVTPDAQQPEAPKRPPAPRKAKGAATVIETTVEPAETAPVETFAQAAAATPPVEPAPEPAKPATEPTKAAPEPPKSVVAAVPSQPRAFLSDKEEIEAEVKVIEAVGVYLTKGGTTHAAVKAKLKGGFNGDVYHLKGGEASGEDVLLREPWKVGASLKIKLQGELSPKSGKVLAYVQAAEECQEVF